ncbi:uncharacterized protein LOC119986859 [Tripterygium wilfordii]|uniref:uncharacterized protein LOC119986859 n=1 Tax=Tripterygium wilfordii TaxID=458696 RepID=UPI0018F7E55B|nr:uncharacterized protein LOC119986859 [Tripterygium wilfordii]
MGATTRNGNVRLIFLSAMVMKIGMPTEPTEESTEEYVKDHEKWKKANRLAMLLIQRSMTKTVRGGIPECVTTKDYFAAIHEKFKESGTAQTGSLLTSLTNMKYDGAGSVREHILKMGIANKLGDLVVPLNNQLLVHMTLNSLSSKYEQLKISYNTQKEKWTINDLISMCPRGTENE